MDRRNRIRTAVVALVAVAVLFGLTACFGNKATQPWNDSPRTSVVNSTPADVIAMPDGFNNLATKCDHGNRIYVSYHSDGSYGFAFGIANDPTCK